MLLCGPRAALLVGALRARRRRHARSRSAPSPKASCWRLGDLFRTDLRPTPWLRFNVGYADVRGSIATWRRRRPPRVKRSAAR